MKKEEKANIKIYVVCHKPAFVPENPYLFPIQVGSVLSDEHYPDMLHDDEGENISEKNKSYCELTAQYWVWKNEDADYYGFFHYRRYFSFDEKIDRDDGWGNIVYDKIDQKAIEELRLKPAKMKNVITQYDFITVKGRKCWEDPNDEILMDVYHEYGTPSFQHRKDLDVTLRVMLEKYPEFKNAADEYLHSNIAHECNMFIMKKEVYHAYCAWLFDILFEAEKEIDTTWYSVEEYRVMGYLAERLCGIYYTYYKNKCPKKCFELPKALFRETTPFQTLTPVFKESIPIVLSANDGFAPYLDVAIRSIIAHASDVRNYDIIVLYNDISVKNQSWIGNAAKNKKNIQIRFVRVSQYFDSNKLFVDQHLSVETYYRLIIPELMPEYKKILYIDCDLVVNKDLAALYDIDLNGCIVGAVKDIDVAGNVNLKNNQWNTYIPEKLGLENAFDYFQAGVLVIDLDKLRNTTSSEEMIKLALSDNWRCHDQDVLNMICKKKVYYLAQNWNVLMNWEEGDRSRMQILKMAPRDLYEQYLAARKEPYIVHFAGYQKPWNVEQCDLADFFWNYARQSPYYPMMIKKLCPICIERQPVYELQSRKWVDNRLLRKIADNIVPLGTRRRECLKRLIGIG